MALRSIPKCNDIKHYFTGEVMSDNTAISDVTNNKCLQKDFFWFYLYLKNNYFQEKLWLATSEYHTKISICAQKI